MDTETFQLSVDGLAIVGEVYWPQASAVPAHPGLIMCHGIPAATYDPSDRSYAALARDISQQGFAVLIFNFRGAGLSQGNFDILGWARDLQAMVDYMHERREIDRKRLYLLGSSAGAAVSVYVAAQDPRIAALACLACPARFGVERRGAAPILEHARQVGIIQDPAFPPSLEAWRDGFREASPLRWIDRISPRPLLLVHGEKDELIDLAQAKELYEQAGEPKELVILPGLGHRLRRERSAMQVAVAWLKRLPEGP